MSSRMVKVDQFTNMIGYNRVNLEVIGAPEIGVEEAFISIVVVMLLSQGLGLWE